MRPLRVTKWVLDASPEVVTKLRRDTSGLIVIVKNTEKLQIPNAKLLVPQQTAVYEVLGEYNSKSQFFFITTYRDLDPAYLF